MQKRASHRMCLLATLAIGLGTVLCAGYTGVSARQNAMAAEEKEQPYVIEYYYKAK